jgi:type IV fimbrial biogenesis protein FimT
MIRRQQGFSILELLIAMTVLGILVAMGASTMPRDRFAVNQAAEGLARDVQFARFQAINRNTFIGISVPQESSAYQIFTTDRTGAYSTGNVIKSVQMGSSDRPQAAIGTVSPNNIILFDPRGISLTGDSKTIVIKSTASPFTRTISINAQGKATIQ